MLRPVSTVSLVVVCVVVAAVKSAVCPICANVRSDLPQSVLLENGELCDGRGVFCCFLLTKDISVMVKWKQTTVARAKSVVRLVSTVRRWVQ